MIGTLVNKGHDPDRIMGWTWPQLLMTYQCSVVATTAMVELGMSVFGVDGGAATKPNPSDDGKISDKAAGQLTALMRGG